MTVTDELLAHAERFADDFRYADLATPPARQLTIVTCMDSRIDVFALLGVRIGDAHVIRNAGGYATDDVLRSLSISQRALGTREILVIHHTRCGMTGFDDPAFRAALEEETGQAPGWRVDGNPDPETALRASLTSIRDCRFIPHREALRGFVYDVDTGRLHEVTA